MGLFDYKDKSVSTPSIAAGTVGIAAIVGTAVDLAGRQGAMMLWTFGSAIGTAAVAPWIHESTDNSTWGTAAAATVQGNRHGSLVGTTSAPATGLSWLMGYTGNARYIRAFLNSGGALQGGTAVGGSSSMLVAATVVSFATGAVPVSGT